MNEESSEPPDNKQILNPLLINQYYLFEDVNISHKLKRKLELKVVSNLNQCQEIWNLFSSKKSLFDLWSFRFSWYEGYQYQPCFYTIYEEKKPLACLPLWFDIEKKRFEWFGSYWMEDNDFFYLDDRFIKILFKIAPKPVYLNAISSSLVKKVDFFENHSLLPDRPKYVFQFNNIKNMDQYLSTLSKKHRYNLKRDYLNIKKNFKPKIEIFYSNNFSYFEELISLSKKRFNGMLKDQTDLIIPQRIKTYKSILKNQGNYRVKFVRVQIQNFVAAIDLVIVTKDRYYPLKGANDINRFPGIGNFMTYIEFEDALKTGFSYIDCLQDDYGWKHKYLSSKHLFKIHKI